MSEPVTPETINTYHIFLASPGDMNEERQMVRNFFNDYNRNYANQRKVRFEVIDWENYTTIGLGRPQELITKQTLAKYRKSLVLFIGLLGQRFGTPTGEYESGTEEEYETVLEFRKAQGDYPEIKWFFREEWGNQAPTDAKAMKIAFEQMTKVEAFKTRLQNGKTQFYTASFKNTGDFQNTFQADLVRWLNDPERPWEQSKISPPNLPEHLNSALGLQYMDSWFQLLRKKCAYLPLPLLEAKQGMESSDPIELHNIFVPLKAIAPTKTWKKSRQQDLSLAREMAAGGKDKPKPVLQLLNKQRLAVIIGDPGSGKSALVNQLTWSLLTPGQERFLPKTLKGLTPLRIILRSVEIPPQAEQGQASWLWDAAEREEQAVC